MKRIGKGALQGGGERLYEDAQLVVVIIEGKPGGGAIDRLYPLLLAASFCQSQLGQIPA